MLKHGGAACAAILVLAASVTPAAAQMQVLSIPSEVRIDVRDVNWSDPEAVERLHQNLQRAARTLCDVPNVKTRDVRRCMAQTVADAVAESESSALHAHWRDCPNRIPERG